MVASPMDVTGGRERVPSKEEAQLEVVAMRENHFGAPEVVVPVVEEKPMRTWLWPTMLILASIIGIGIIVMVLVSNADFDTGPAKVTPTPGSCEPFCTNTVAPPGP